MAEHDATLLAQVGRLLGPRSVAVVGASEDRGKFGGRALHLLVRHGFAGAIYPVNPRRDELLGLRSFPSIAALPETPDVAILAIPRGHLRAAIEECAARGVGACIVITSQFAEVGAEGAREQAELVAIARAAGMRLLGPNCLGLISPANHAVLTTSPALDVDALRAGTIGLVSQSGALMATIFDRAASLGIGFSHCVSVGNQADLEAADVIEYLIADERTHVICAYIEGFREPARALALAARAREAGTPLLVVKAGRTAAGERAALSHTASLAGSYAVLEAFARERGMTLMDDPDAMILAASLLARFGPLAGDRAAIVTTSGGCGAISADRLSDAGIALASFAPETSAALEPWFMPGQASNPVDLGGRREGEAVNVAEVALRAVASDPGVGVMLLPLSTAPAMERIASDLATAGDATGKPYLIIEWPGPSADAARAQLLSANAPFCDRLDDAIRALRGWIDASRVHQALHEERPDGIAADAPLLLAELPAGALGEVATKALLRAWGVPINTGMLAASEDDAVAAAEAIGYPVALKIVAEGISHKSDIGGVALDLTDADELRAAWRAMHERVARHAPDARIEGALVQEMAAGELELIVGVRNEPGLGPVVVVGAGGVLVEILRDVAMAPAPLGPRAAARLLRTLRAWPLLAGARGKQALDVATVADVVSRVSWLAWEGRDRLLELDVNPLLVSPDSAVAVDGRALIGG